MKFMSINFWQSLLGTRKFISKFPLKGQEQITGGLQILDSRLVRITFPSLDSGVVISVSHA
jgi:hypothetical protein